MKLPVCARILLSLPLMVSCGKPAKEAKPTESEGLRYSIDWDGVVALSDDACVSCHGPGGTAENLPMPLALHVDLAQQTGRWVVPFDPEASLLWRSLSGELQDGDVGAMPLGSGPLDSSYIDHVRLWILDGAPVPPLLVDNDGDGFLSDVDCDDADPAIHPDAVEVCDGVDNNCSGDVDGADVTDGQTYYLDDDGDGYGQTDQARQACEQPSGYAEFAGDCNDSDVGFNPGISETDCTDPTDYNCDGSAGTDDLDSDGFAACDECNDADPDAFPGAEETCNGLDDDCNGTVDDNAIDAERWWRDDDGDGYGNASGTNLLHCTGTTGWVTNGEDCNDADGAISPAATVDVADGVDNDCDGDIDEDAGAAVSHAVSIQPIWDNSCLAPCHSGFLPSDGINLSGSGWDELVGVPSNDVGSMNRVEPGDPANSYLWHKLNNSQGSVGGSGSRMPKGGQGLSSSDLALIEQWILDGAAP